MVAHQEDYTIPLYDSEGNVIGEYSMGGYGKGELKKAEISQEAARLQAAYEKAKAEEVPFEEGDPSYPWEKNPALAAAQQTTRNYPDYGTVDT